MLLNYPSIKVGEDYHAHDHKPTVIHRDIKPENILLRSQDGPAIIADFGICYIEGSDRRTSVQEKVGPRWFIAPELQDGRLEDIKPSSDVYMLGKILYWLLSGGRIFTREEHRKKRYDLCEILKNPRMEHANRFFDMTIVEEPEKRYQDAGMVAQAARKLYHLISGRYNVVSPKIPQPCMYCGLGIYRLVGQGDIAFFAVSHEHRNPGFEKPDWRVLQCDECGHIQLFRADKAARKDWWRE